MGVSQHLGIRLEEYDARIRTFIPRYEEMIRAAAKVIGTLETETPHIVDLGTGTGALAAECLRIHPRATVTAIDADPDILDLARRRLRDHLPRVTLVGGSFVDVPLPGCDAIVASLALHHIRNAAAKRAMYRRCHEAIRSGGLLVSADSCPASDARLAASDRADWRDHLQQYYSAEETDRHFASWAEEDVYFQLSEELAFFRDAGFSPDVAWRGGFLAVISARRS